MSNANYYVSRFVMTGGKHRRRGLPGQDHAEVQGCDQGVVLVVADGVSVVGQEFSRAEIGAYLAAHLACRAALEGVEAGEDLGGLKGRIGAALYHGLRGLWTEMPSHALAPALSSTLLVAVVMPERTAIWASGDGCWGVCAPPTTRVEVSKLTRPTPVGWSTSPTPCGQAIVVGGTLHTQLMGKTAVTESRRSPEDAAAQLELMLLAKGPVFGAYVASDGLADEPNVARVLQQPVRSRSAVEDSLIRGDRGDDLGIAWAAERFPGLLGLGDIATAEAVRG